MPDVNAEQQNAGNSENLMRLQLAKVFSVPPFAQGTVGNGDQHHRYPCPKVLPHRQLRFLNRPA